MTRGYAPPEALGSGLLRLTAPNPSPMTAGGTNSYVLGGRDVAVIDPGPAVPAHLDALADAVAGRPVRAVLVTHAHLDHSPGAAPLAARLGAPVLAFGPPEAGRSDTMRALLGLGGVGRGRGLRAGRHAGGRRRAGGRRMDAARAAHTRAHGEPSVLPLGRG